MSVSNPIVEFYPPNPTNVPAHLTKPSFLYQLHAVVVIGCLLLFVLVYLLLIAVFAGLSLFCLSGLFHHPLYEGITDSSVLAVKALLAIVGGSAGLVALYFIKGLFKSHRWDDSRYLVITEAEQPRLFAFIRQICADTGAPMPAQIVVSPEVNASVFYACTFSSLFFPVRKKLHIGLGLVNCLNLTEFKAVLAHEFGHFSQKSMRLGAYVYMANRIITEIVYGRDWLDNFLTIFSPVLNLVRWVLSILFRVLNFADASLSRQMEFQADLVAVSVTGSDAIVHGLLKTDFAQQCIEQTWQDLTAAGDHKLFTQDLFLHQSDAAEYLRVLKADPLLGIPRDCLDEQVGEMVFPPNETVLPPMWASHPPHYEREKNCKRIVIQGPKDNRPAWVLFDDPDTLRQRMTRRYYEVVRPNEPAANASTESVQRFIEEERAETIYSARYHGMYEEGYIGPGPIDALVKYIPPRYEQPARLLCEHADIFNPDLRERLKLYKQRRLDQQRLFRFANHLELPKGGVFRFEEKEYRTAEAARLLPILEAALKADRDYLASLDRRIFLVYMGMARQLHPQTGDELDQRYRFHLTVQEIFRCLVYWHQQVQEGFHALAGQRQPDPNAVRAVAAVLGEAEHALNDQLAAANSIRLPAFKNMRAGEPLLFFLEAKPLIRDIFGSEQLLSGAWIQQILQRYAEVLDKLRRLLFKSLGSLLSFQERVGEEWKAKYAPEENHEEEPARGQRERPKMLKAIVRGS